MLFPPTKVEKVKKKADKKLLCINVLQSASHQPYCKIKFSCYLSSTPPLPVPSPQSLSWGEVGALIEEGSLCTEIPAS